MDDEFSELVIDVRATTEGFATDIGKMRATLDTNLIDGFGRAGDTLERSLVNAIRKGSLGFDDLKRAAFQAFDQIAAQALQSGLGSIFGAQGGGLGDLLNGTIGALFGLPGRATGGPVSPGRGYIVGERGPEVFVPTSSGHVNPGPGQNGTRDVRVAIQMRAPAGTAAPTAMRRSSRQLASAVRRALLEG